MSDDNVLVSHVHRPGSHRRGSGSWCACGSKIEFRNDQWRAVPAGMSRAPNVYEAFIEEVDHMVIAAGDSAVAVVGDLTRAVKRAQMVVDGELPRIRERLGLPAGPDYCEHEWEPFLGVSKCAKCGQLGRVEGADE